MQRWALTVLSSCGDFQGIPEEECWWHDNACSNACSFELITFQELLLFLVAHGFDIYLLHAEFQMLQKQTNNIQWLLTSDHTVSKFSRSHIILTSFNKSPNTSGHCEDHWVSGFCSRSAVARSALRRNPGDVLGQVGASNVWNLNEVDLGMFKQTTPSSAFSPPKKEQPWRSQASHHHDVVYKSKSWSRGLCCKICWNFVGRILKFEMWRVQIILMCVLILHLSRGKQLLT